jgi:PPM family protein phosphatase
MAGGGFALARDGVPHYAVRSQINQRDNNEDSFLVLPLCLGGQASPLYLLAVADGMGGHAHGEHISYQALKKLSLGLFEQLVTLPNLNHLQPAALTAQNLVQVLTDALPLINIYIQKMIQANRWERAGSTLVVALILGNEVVVTNLGDSPLFYINAADQTCRQITAEHTVAGMLLRANLITPEMAQVHQGKNQLEYFIGCDHLPEPLPMHRLTLGAKDRLLLCSDGISGSLDLKLLQQLCSQDSLSLDEIADRLLEAALSAGETDNQTLILWESPCLNPGIPSEVAPPLESTPPTVSQTPYLR